MRNQNFRDEGLRAKLNEHEVTPPSYVWENINDRLQESRPNKRNKFFYYLLPLAACVTAAVMYFALIRPGTDTGVDKVAVEGRAKGQEPVIANHRGASTIEQESSSSRAEEIQSPVDAPVEGSFTNKADNINIVQRQNPVNKSGILNIEKEGTEEQKLIKNENIPAIARDIVAYKPISLISIQTNLIPESPAFPVAAPLENPIKPFAKKTGYNKGWAISAYYAMLPNMSSPFNVKSDVNENAFRSQSTTNNNPVKGKNEIHKNYRQAGVLVRKRLSNSFSIGSGFTVTDLNYTTEYAPLITKYSTSTTYTTTETNKTLKEKYTFGEIPLMIHYQTPGRGIALFAEAGPSLRVNINSKITEDIRQYSDIKRIIRDTQIVFVGNSFVSYAQETTYVEEVSYDTDQEEVFDRNVSYAIPMFGLNINIRGGICVPLLKNVVLEAGPVIQYSSPLSQTRYTTMNFGLAGAVSYRF